MAMNTDDGRPGAGREVTTSAATDVGRQLALTPVPRDAWREVVADDPEALPEHTPEWIDAVCAGGVWADASRMYVLSDGRRFVLPLVRRRGATGLGGWSVSYPPAWGIGGVVGADLDVAALKDILTDLRRTGLQRIGIRPNPLQAEVWAAATSQSVLDGQLGGRALIAIPRRAHVLDLAGGFDAVQARLRPATRGFVRRAQRCGVEVRLDRTGALLDRYYALYLKSLERWAVRQHEPVGLARWRGRRRDPVAKLQAMSAALGERFVTALAVVEGQPAFGVIAVLGRTAHAIRSAMDIELVGKTKAGSLVHVELLRLACAEGCSRYHLGESGASTSLAQFKESFGARPYDYAEYRIERLPYTRLDLTARGMVKKLLRFKDV